MDGLSVSAGGAADLKLLLAHRLNMFKEMYPEIAHDIDAQSDMTESWLKSKLNEGVLVPFVARLGGNIAGSACLLIREDQPRPGSSLIEHPYLMSMYVERDSRQRGIATEITIAAIAWSREHGYDRIILHASSAGRGVYEKLGFRQSNEMKLLL